MLLDDYSAQNQYWLLHAQNILLSYFILLTGIVHGLVTVAQKERLPGLYRGMGPTLLAIAPFMAVQQASYDVLKQQALLYQFQPSPTLFFACGSVAGAAAQTVRISTLHAVHIYYSGISCRHAANLYPNLNALGPMHPFGNAHLCNC